MRLSVRRTRVDLLPLTGTYRRLVLMFLFSFEVDVLEIALREQQDLVDKIFLVESSASHRGVRRFSFYRWTENISR